MELVYLWVENHKNIHEQGFNFSPKFICDYDEAKNELMIEDNPAHILEFFGKNINVTAIVGKNGSGKSSLIESLLSVLSMHNELSKYIFVYYKNDKFYLYTNKIIEYKKNIFIEIDDPYAEGILSLSSDTVALYITNQTKLSSEDLGEEINTMPGAFSQDEIDVLTSNTNKNFSQILILNLFVEHETRNLLKELNDFFIPKTVQIRIIDEMVDIRKLTKHELSYIKNMEDSLLALLKKGSFKEYIKLTIKMIDFYRNSRYFQKNNISEFDFELEKLQYNYDLRYEFDSLLSRLPIQSYEDSIFYTFDIDKITREEIHFIASLPTYLFELKLIDHKKSFEDLSYGESQLLLQLSSIFDSVKKKMYDKVYTDEGLYSKKIEISNILVFLDEFEISLHPEWQQKVIKYLMTFFTIFDKEVSLIITSHSPFILSDIPKQNIIFLDTYENGNCKVLTHDEVLDIKQTFGANIHTLLSDSFFMDEGLMGEFAKEKINEIIDFFNNKNNIYEDDKEKLLKIINTIGEPFLKEKLLSMYSEKYPKTNDEKIADLKAEIQRLENG